ncbi:Protein TIFY 10B [Zea mays]|uniref:Protein TIFY n=1 Tax=Zea mays TaxID=4577 RepID=A0A1D6K5B5_MAIZE|nr:Protein TIFY 10B [Zea mays]
MAPAESGEKATSFAMACSLLSRYVRQNGAAAADLGLAIRAESDAKRTSTDMEKGETGKVLVFDDFPAEKAKDLMQMASKGSPVAQNPGLLPPSTAATVTDSTKIAAVPAAPIAVANAQKSAADIPQAPKASLRRFLEKRKDRLTAKAPYPGSPSDVTPVKKEMSDGQPWLGLGPQIANPDLSLSKEASQ